MNRTELEERKATIEQQFTEYDAELKRLQGEHRLVVELLNKTEDTPVREKRIRKIANAENIK